MDEYIIKYIDEFEVESYNDILLLLSKYIIIVGLLMGISLTNNDKNVKDNGFRENRIFDIKSVIYTIISKRKYDKKPDDYVVNKIKEIMKYDLTENPYLEYNEDVSDKVKELIKITLIGWYA